MHKPFFLCLLFFDFLDINEIIFHLNIFLIFLSYIIVFKKTIHLSFPNLEVRCYSDI